MQERSSHKAILQPVEHKDAPRPLFSYFFPEENGHPAEYVDAHTQEEAEEVHKQNLAK